jgi:hypothetical protein
MPVTDIGLLNVRYRNHRTPSLLAVEWGSTLMRAWPRRAMRYREEADRLRREAETVHDAETRIELLELAQKYEALANSVARVSENFSRVLARLRSKS